MTSAMPTEIIVQRCTDRKWQYPTPIEDLDAWLAVNADEFDPRHVHHMYWPDRPYRADMDILVVDGGTTQAPVIARTNPGARVTTTVQTKESHDHAIYLRHKYRLLNMDVKLLPIERVSGLDGNFDLVIASGVLQNSGYSEAEIGMRDLAQVMRPDGVAAFLVFSRYVPAVSDTSAVPNSPGLCLRVQDCLDLVDAAGLVFQDWMIRSPLHLPAGAGSTEKCLSEIRHLPERRMWSVLEPLRNQSGRLLFMASRPERPVTSYRIDFDGDTAANFVPTWRLNAQLDGEHAIRTDWSMRLTSDELAMARRIDGEQDIQEIAGEPALVPQAIGLVKHLWQMDFVSIRFGGTSRQQG